MASFLLGAHMRAGQVQKTQAAWQKLQSPVKNSANPAHEGFIDDLRSYRQLLTVFPVLCREEHTFLTRQRVRIFRPQTPSLLGAQSRDEAAESEISQPTAYPCH